ncbi:MAG: purine-nucleoside phosphorylase [Spirochaetia bacterium]|jgi:purine-nucleoside phosphorylase|nr:purine-nucleoside phosphorylase [Spirochaetia bacterium]
MEQKLKIRAAGQYIKSVMKSSPDTALILGSGLGMLADELSDAIRIPYGDIPYFPVSTAPGHAGVMTLGRLQDRDVLVMGGRFHYYEGYDMESIAFPVRVMHELGVKNIVITNAAGGINLSFKPGNLMILSDHINMTGQNPLRGPNDPSLGTRFPDMGRLYDRSLSDIVRKVAQKNGIECRSGVYAWMTGPSFETPAEIRMLRALGADAVGMSTVPEAITAHHCGLRVVGVSCISNMAAGVLDQKVTEEEVFEITQRVKDSFSSLIRGFLEHIDEDQGMREST